MAQFSRRDCLRAIPLAIATGMAGCFAESSHPVSEPIEDWQSFRGDEYNTGFARGETDLREDPAIHWTFETGDSIWGSPAVTDGSLFIGSTDGTLYALDAETGDDLWSFHTGRWIEGTPACTEETVFVGSFDRHVYALDSETGDIIWEVETPALVRSSPAVVDGTVYVGVGCQSLACAQFAEDLPESGWVYAIDAESGDIDWTVEIGEEVLSSPAVANGTVYIGASDDTLYAIDTGTAEIDWTFDAAADIWSTPAVAFGSVYFADWSATVYGVEADSGDEEWSYDTGGSYVTSSPAVNEESVFIGHTPATYPDEEQFENAGIFALDRETGQEEWAFETVSEEIGSSPVVTEDMVYLSTHGPPAGEFAPPEPPQRGVYGLSVDGDEQWFFEIDRRGAGSSPALLNGTLYFGTANGDVFALR